VKSPEPLDWTVRLFVGPEVGEGNAGVRDAGACLICHCAKNVSRGQLGQGR
jgi:hypothetical protein